MRELSTRHEEKSAEEMPNVSGRPSRMKKIPLKLSDYEATTMTVRRAQVMEPLRIEPEATDHHQKSSRPSRITHKPAYLADYEETDTLGS